MNEYQQHTLSHLEKQVADQADSITRLIQALDQANQEIAVLRLALESSKRDVGAFRAANANTMKALAAVIKERDNALEALRGLRDQVFDLVEIIDGQEA